MSQSDAQRRAKAKYNNKTYKRLTLQTTFSEHDEIVNFCNVNNISYTRFCVRACEYFIQRGELPPESTVDGDDFRNINKND